MGVEMRFVAARRQNRGFPKGAGPPQPVHFQRAAAGIFPLNPSYRQIKTSSHLLYDSINFQTSSVSSTSRE